MSLEINLDTSINSLLDEAIVLSLFDERIPLHGYSGIVDWELCGNISRLIAQRSFEGREKSKMLLYITKQCYHGRKVLIYGLGKRAYLTPKKLSLLTEDLLETLSKLFLHNVIYVLPPMSDINFDVSSLLESIAYAIVKFTSNQSDTYKLWLMWDSISKSDIIKSFKFAISAFPNASLSIIEKED